MGLTFRAAALAQMVQGTLLGDGERLVNNAKPPEEAVESDITFALNVSAERLLSATRAGVVVTAKAAPLPNLTQIVVENPRLAMAKILSSLHPKYLYQPPSGINPTAVVHPTATVHPSAAVAACVFIGPNSHIGANSCLYPGVYVGEGVHIGEACLVYPNVVFMDQVILGNRVIIHSGSVIGADGYGFVATPQGHLKVPQVGNVTIGNDVEIGANVAIDRATMGTTAIQEGTKIDNLVHIGHNNQIGKHCLLVSQVGLAGSVKVGDRTVIAGQAGVANHTTIGSDCLILARSGVTKDLADHAKVSGFPAQDHIQELRQQAARNQIPQLIEQLRLLQARVQYLEARLGAC
jgi:UDP-3-O-[3-hydroxymyristoyl] glucosamine N-acyltransferase